LGRKSICDLIIHRGKAYIKCTQNDNNFFIFLLAISFATLFLVRHLEHKVRVQYKKLSAQYIRKLLLNTQTSILYSKAKKIKYAIPSQMKAETIKMGLVNFKSQKGILKHDYTE